MSTRIELTPEEALQLAAQLAEHAQQVLAARATGLADAYTVVPFGLRLGVGQPAIRVRIGAKA